MYWLPKKMTPKECEDKITVSKKPVGVPKKKASRFGTPWYTVITNSFNSWPILVVQLMRYTHFHISSHLPWLGVISNQNGTQFINLGDGGNGGSPHYIIWWCTNLAFINSYITYQFLNTIPSGKRLHSELENHHFYQVNQQFRNVQ